MRPYRTSGTALVYDWTGQTPDSVRIDAFLVWLQAVCIDPEMVTTGHVTNRESDRRVNFADIPVARTRVTFGVFDTPARCIHILDISDEMFRAPT